MRLYSDTNTYEFLPVGQTHMLNQIYVLFTGGRKIFKVPYIWLPALQCVFKFHDKAFFFPLEGPLNYQ